VPGEILLEQHRRLRPVPQLHQFAGRLDRLLLLAELADEVNRHRRQPRHQPDHRQRRQDVHGIARALLGR